MLLPYFYIVIVCDSHAVFIYVCACGQGFRITRLLNSCSRTVLASCWLQLRSLCLKQLRAYLLRWRQEKDGTTVAWRHLPHDNMWACVLLWWDSCGLHAMVSELHALTFRKDCERAFWQGVRTVTLAGFPCQPYSSEGVRLGWKDSRGETLFRSLVQQCERLENSLECILGEDVSSLVQRHTESWDSMLSLLRTALPQFQFHWKILAPILL